MGDLKKLIAAQTGTRPEKASLYFFIELNLIYFFSFVGWSRYSLTAFPPLMNDFYRFDSWNGIYIFVTDLSKLLMIWVSSIQNSMTTTIFYIFLLGIPNIRITSLYQTMRSMMGQSISSTKTYIFAFFSTDISVVVVFISLGFLIAWV